MSYFDLQRQPDHVTVFSESGERVLSASGAGDWWSLGINVATPMRGDEMKVHLAAPGERVLRVRLRWHGEFSPSTRFLGDHWERGYGDLEWRSVVPERVMPWYFFSHDSDGTHGYGVQTGAGSMCFWQTDSAGVSLWLDVRNGGRGVDLGERKLHAATVVTRRGAADESAFAASRAFCRLMCTKPLMPAHPVYGSNNWYYAYGHSSHEQILKDTELLVSLSPKVENRPYMMIDAGWSPEGSCNGSAWDRGNEDFPDMARLASEMRSVGARPGLWIRPLAVPPGWQENWLLRTGSDGVHVIDPTIPEALAHVRRTIGRIREWDYELIKHDFSTFDLLQKWGFAMGADLTPSDWSFADQTRTTAEIILDLYRTIRAAAGDAVVIGCNTVGHLAAGLVEIQRTGDDTSGKAWERTRKMGVNTLAFRMAQHDAFFAVDADCVGLTKHVPWEQNRQWLDLLARSGTPLFVSADPIAVGPEQATALRQAYAVAATAQPVAEPLDWLTNTCPARWSIDGKEEDYQWIEPGGAMPFFYF